MDLQQVSKKLQRMECSEHHQHPEVVVRGKKLEFKCCCENFRSRLVKEAQPLIEKAIKTEIEDAIKKAFR